MKSYSCISRIFLFSLLTLVVLGFSERSLAQERTGKIAVGIPVQVTSLEFLFKIFASNEVAIEPFLGFNRISKDETSGENWKLGAGITYNWGGDKLMKYVGLAAGLNTLSSGNKSYTDKLVGGRFGLEYFLIDHLSAVGELQFNVFDADNEFSPSGLGIGTTNYNTAEVLAVRFYF